MDLVRIVHPDRGLSTGNGTRVFTKDGQEIDGISKISVTFAPDELLVAEITIAVEVADFEATPLLSLESVELAAQRHGYALVKIPE